MSYPINYPTPQGANIQTFPKGGTFDWVKPQGASFVWFTLIGAGGGGGSGDGDFDGGGGGSGAVTNFMCPAFLIPDVLRVSVGAGGAHETAGQSTNLVYQQKNSTGYTLLTANGGGGGNRGGPGGNGATAMTANYFTPIGFFQSIAGQNGSQGNPGASATTFLGGGGAGQSIGSNYGYSRDTSAQSYGQLQPIIVSTGGGSIGGSGLGATGSFGSGGGGALALASPGGRGGDGLVVIITW
jgi:hypothetical protein